MAARDEKLFFKRTEAGLVPMSEAAGEFMRGLKVGALVEMKSKGVARNVRLHRFYWKLCGLLAESVRGDFTAENISDVLKIRVGHVTTIKTKRGLVEVPKSIAFDATDDREFREFLNRVTRVVSEDYLDEMPPTQIRREVEAMLGA